jgi:PAS domain S-box-containing protein
MPSIQPDNAPDTDRTFAVSRGEYSFVASDAPDVHRLLEQLTNAYLEVDERWSIVGVDDRATRYFGVHGESLLGRVFWEAFPSTVGTPFEQESHRVMRDRQSARLEGRSPGPFGLPTESYLCPRERGLRIYYRTVGRDANEAALRASEAKYRKLISLLPAAVYSCDAEGRITFFNRRAAELWGREPRLFDEHDKYCGSFRLHSLSEQPLRHYDCWMALTLRTGVPFRDQKIIVERPDGTRITAAANIEPLFDDEGRLTGAINVLQDVTERQRAEVHDRIQQLLVAAQMQVESMTRGMTPLSLDSVAQRVASILKDAIAASRTLSVDLSSPGPQQSGLTAGLAWLSAHVKERYDLTVHFRDWSQIASMAVSEQLSAVLLESIRELLINCVKHAKVQTVRLNLAQDQSNQLQLVVEDRSGEFDPSVLDRDKAHGFRLGLFRIGQRLAEFGGRIELEADPGKAVRVILSVPPRFVASLQAPADEAAKAQERQEGDDGIRVLLVDDHKILRDGLARLLEGEPDIEIVGEAEDGLQAVELAGSLLPDVVVMDVNLPRMNGIEATRKLRRKNPETKVVGLSMHSEEDIKKRMREAGAEAYVLKGAPATDLIQAIRNCGHSNPPDPRH